MWSGMLIIAGSEKERAQARLSPLISHLYTPGKQRQGQRLKPLVSASGSIRLIGLLRPHFQNSSLQTPCYISLQPLHFICLTLIILVLNPLFSWHIEIERMVNCHLHKSNSNGKKKMKNEIKQRLYCCKISSSWNLSSENHSG